jgi:hypothetical protein
VKKKIKWRIPLRGHPTWLYFNDFLWWSYDLKIPQNGHFGVFYGHMATIKHTWNIAKWGVPLKSTKNVTQSKKPDLSIFILPIIMAKIGFFLFFALYSPCDLNSKTKYAICGS